MRQGGVRVAVAVRRLVVGVVVGRGLDRVAGLRGQQRLVDGVRAARRTGSASEVKAGPDIGH